MDGLHIMSFPKTSPVFRKTPAPGPGFSGGPLEAAGNDWERTTRKPLLVFLFSGLLLSLAAQRRKETGLQAETRKTRIAGNPFSPFPYFNWAT